MDLALPRGFAAHRRGLILDIPNLCVEHGDQFMLKQRRRLGQRHQIRTLEALGRNVRIRMLGRNKLSTQQHARRE